MKRAGLLFDKILERENLRLATAKASRGKRHRPAVVAFRARIDENLGELADQVKSGCFPIGRFHQFLVHDPKTRIITAPCFAERVLHHAIMNVCEPVFERWLIDDSFACRRGKGRDRAVLRASEFSRRSPFYLKLDVRKYFDSIHHSILLERIERLFKDQRLLDLFAKIVHGFRGQLGKGLPIGSLVSQHLANFYLGWFDRFMKQTERCKGYVRYMDDIAVWGDSKEKLLQQLHAAETFLDRELALEWKGTAVVQSSVKGMSYLGFRVFPTHVTLASRSKIRYRRRAKWLLRQWDAGEIGELELQSRLTSLTAFVRSEGVSSWRFRSGFLSSLLESI